MYTLLNKEHFQNKNIVINSSEFAISQVTSILDKFFPDSYTSTDSHLEDMNNIVTHSVDYLRDYRMVQWTWEKATELLGWLNREAIHNIAIDIIVNDFMLRPEDREIVKIELPIYFPVSLRDVLKKWNMDYRVHNGLAYISTDSDKLYPLRFVFESTLRNKARKILKKMLDSNAVIRHNLGLCVILNNQGIQITSEPDFPYLGGEKLFLTEGDIPICSALMLAYFIKRRGNLIVNVVDNNWKCSYQRGALAVYNLLPGYGDVIYNFNYPLNKDEPLFYDIFQPSYLARTALSDKLQSSTILIKKCQRLTVEP